MPKLKRKSSLQRESYNRELQKRRKLDPVTKEVEQQKNTEQHKVARRNPARRAEEQQRNTEQHKVARRNPARRAEEQQRDTEQHKVTRRNPARRAEEQQRDTEHHKVVRRNPSRRVGEQTRDTAARRRSRNEEQSSYSKLLEKYKNKITASPNFICSCCGGLWYEGSTKIITREGLVAAGHPTDLINEILFVDQENHKLCVTCRKSVSRGCLPKLSLANGFDFPKIPHELQDLSQLEERLVALRLPFMQIRFVGTEKQSKLRGNVVNVENNLDICSETIPRNFDQTMTVQVQLMRRMRYNTPYMYETIRPYNVDRAARYLIQTELYKSEGITLSGVWGQPRSGDTLPYITDKESFMNDHTPGNDDDAGAHDNESSSSSEDEETQDENQNLGAEETLIFSERDVMNQLRVRIAPAEMNSPLSLLRDLNAEVLSFPTIYCGVKRTFKEGLNISYTDIAKSEIRRYDRRACKPSKVLYSFKKSFNEKVVQAMQVCLRKRQGQAPLTAGNALNPNYIQSLFTKDDGYAVFKNLRSSPAYWKGQVKKILAQIRQIGTPCWFGTFSAAETKWTELLQVLHSILNNETITEEEVKQLSFEEVSELIRSDPVTCMRHFDNRFRALLNILLKSSGGVFAPYKLQDYFTRIEFQMRGSPHSHGLYWIENSPIYAKEIPETEAECVEFIDKFLTCERCEDEDMTNLISYQLHKHSFTCKKGNRKGTKCRFGFPIPPMNATRILEPLPKNANTKTLKESKDVLERLKERLETMGRSFKEDIPFENFLQSLDITHEKYILAVRSSIKRTTVFLKRSTNAIYINSYNKKLLQAWGANIDLQFIVDPYACAKYAVGYMLKAEGGVSKLLRQVSEEVNRGNIQVQENLKKFANILINGSEISAPEAAGFLLGIPNTTCSRSDVFINTSRPEQRVHILKSKAQLEELPSESEEVCAEGLIDHYVNRPSEMDNICLAEFAAMYDFSTRSTFKFPVRSDDDYDPRTQEHVAKKIFVLENDSGYVKLRKNPKIIRFRHYGRAQNPSEYFREQLMLFKPWRNEEEELLSVNAEQEYTSHEEQILASSKQYIHNRDVNEHLLQQLFEDAEDEINQMEDDTPLIDEDMEALEIDQSYHTDINLDLGVTKGTQVQHFLPPRMLVDDVYRTLMRSLNDKQRRIVLDTLFRIKTGKEPFYSFLSGGAGVGKTHVISAIVQSTMRYYEKLPNLNPADACVLVSAPTGKAAFNVFGMTLHCTFKLPPSQYGGKLCDLDESVANNLRAKLLNVQLFIIDEISMVSVRQFYDIDQRLRQIFMTEQDFGGKSLLVVGHLRQLPPIGGSYVFRPPRHLTFGQCVGNHLWEKFKLFELTDVMRQRGDYEFCKALNNMAEGCMDQDDIRLLKGREINEDLQPPEDAIRLFFTNAQCAAYNQDVHEHLNTEGCLSVAYDKVQGHGTEDEKIAALNFAKTYTLQQSDGIPTQVYLKVDGEYFVSTNVDVQDGLFNGSTGALKHIEYGFTPNGQKIPICVYMDFRNEMVGAEQRIRQRNRSAERRMDSSWTPVFRFKRTLSRKYQTLEIIREQIPLVAANGMTITKSQGSSLAKVVLCVEGTKGRKLSRELLYVGCSRAISLNGLFIDGTFEPPDPPPENDFVSKEMARLRSEPYPFQLKFLQDYDDDYEKIYFQNVQSFIAHGMDVISDQCCMASNVLAFVEPHLLSSDNIQVPNFDVKHRVDCTRSRNSEGSLVLERSSQECGVKVFHSFSTLWPSTGGHLRIVMWTISNVNVIMVYKSPKYPSPFLVETLGEQIESINGNILIFGDMNVDLAKPEGAGLLALFKSKGLTSKLDIKLPTTDGGTTIDCCFSNCQYINAWLYESYFSYHKGICIVWPKNDVT